MNEEITSRASLVLGYCFGFLKVQVYEEITYRDCLGRSEFTTESHAILHRDM